MITRDILDAVFNAESVAVVGASANPDKIGHQILKNLIGGGYTGALYPVNPKADAILGRTCIADLGSIPGDLDLVVICVPAAATPRPPPGHPGSCRRGPACPAPPASAGRTS